VDLVENRFVGMKSRGVYETPGGTILLHAHRQIETLTMDRDLMHMRDSLVPKYAELIYYGFWFAPEREALQALIDKSQDTVTGTVRLKLYKGNIITVGESLQHRSMTRVLHPWMMTKVITNLKMRLVSYA
jgi:argininosuccinate synthase